MLWTSTCALCMFVVFNMPIRFFNDIEFAESWQNIVPDFSAFGDTTFCLTKKEKLIRKSAKHDRETTYVYEERRLRVWICDERCKKQGYNNAKEAESTKSFLEKKGNCTLIKRKAYSTVSNFVPTTGKGLEVELKLNLIRCSWSILARIVLLLINWARQTLVCLEMYN